MGGVNQVEGDGGLLRELELDLLSKPPVAYGLLILTRLLRPRRPLGTVNGTSLFSRYRLRQFS